MKSILLKAGIVCLLFLFTVQLIMSMRNKSVTVDEIMYITAGYYHLKTGNSQLNMTNPPLVKMLSAIPLLALDVELPPLPKKARDLTLIEQWKYSRSFLYENRIDAEKILFVARLPIVALSLLLGLYVFIWGKQLYGEKAGLFALFLYTFSPNILANSRLATLDLGLAAFMFIATYYFWAYIRRPRAQSLALCGFFFGLAILTKTTGLFLIPIFAMFALVSVILKKGVTRSEGHPVVKWIKQNNLRKYQISFFAGSILLVSILGIAILNIGYGFQGSFEPLTEYFQTQFLSEGRTPMSTVRRWPADIVMQSPVPIPSGYFEVIKSQSRTLGNKQVFVAGKLYPSGLWYATLTAFVVKTPLAVLVLFGVALLSVGVRPRWIDGEILMIVSIASIMGVFSYVRSFNAALRYILPVYPMIHVFTSRIVSVNANGAKRNLWVIPFCVWYLVGTVLIHPHYLAYFNEIVGGPKNGYKYLLDSNLDWGQDLKGLKEYMDGKGIKRIKLGYFGSADASYYGIDYEYLPSVGLAPKAAGQYWWYEIDSGEKRDCRPQKGTIAISATLLVSPGWMRRIFNGCYEWLKQYEPVDNVGYSILIYEIK